MSTDDRPRRTLAAAAAVNFAVGTLFAWSIVVPPLQAEFATPASSLSAIFSVSLVTFALVVLASGGATDRHSPRLLATVAGGAAGAGLAISALARSPTVVGVGFGLLFAFGSGLAYVTVVRVASTRFGPRRGAALGVVVGAYAAGPIIVGPVGVLAIEALGWRATLASLAAAVAAVTIAASAWLPRRAAGGAGQPEATNAASDGPSAARGLWSLWALSLFTTAPALLSFAYATDIAGERGLSGAQAGGAVAAIAAGNLAGRLLAGVASDRLGTVASCRLTVAALAVAALALGWLPGATISVVALSLVGAAYGAVSALLPAMTSDLVGARQFGRAYGRAFSSWAVAGVLGPVLGGALRDSSGGYLLGFRLSLLSAAAGWIALRSFERALTRSRVAASVARSGQASRS